MCVGEPVLNAQDACRVLSQAGHKTANRGCLLGRVVNGRGVLTTTSVSGVRMKWTCSESMVVESETVCVSEVYLTFLVVDKWYEDVSRVALFNQSCSRACCPIYWSSSDGVPVLRYCAFVWVLW